MSNTTITFYTTPRQKALITSSELAPVEAVNMVKKVWSETGMDKASQLKLSIESSIQMVNWIRGNGGNPAFKSLLEKATWMASVIGENREAPEAPAESAEVEAGALAGELTEKSLNLFKMLAEDAPNWSGTPCIGGNFDLTRGERGNLSDLKKKGFLTTFADTEDHPNVSWVRFTDKGQALAKELNIDLGLI